MNRQEKDKLAVELAEIRQAILETEQRFETLLPVEQIAAALAPLREKEATIQARLKGSGAIAQGKGAKAFGERAVDATGARIGGSIISGQVNVTITSEKAAQEFWRQFSGTKPDLELATIRYLDFIARRYLFLDFRGMGVFDRVPLRLPLAEMYVPLKARIEMPKGETWARELRVAGRRASAEEVDAMGQRVSEPRPVVDLLQEQNGLIILGDPGAGKTTFLKYLALLLALGEEEVSNLGRRLPILLPLSAYANALADKDVPLHRFIAQYYESLGIEEPLAEMLDEALNRGGALLLLDGLDEVQQLAQRNLVIDRVLDFFTYRQAQGNKFILTSRIVGYREVRPAVSDMAECTLVDFDDEEIALFVSKWTAALERQAYGESEVAVLEAQREQGELMASVHHNPGVRRLAANPLLLTILALMKRQGVVLPERRVELYQKYVETLLKHWNLARGLGRFAGRDLDVVETIRVLAPLALWMHETNPGVGLVKREDVRRKLETIYRQRGLDDPARSAWQLLADARDYASLLLERGAGEYGFIHLTFQEYLAAVAIGRQGQGDADAVAEALAEYVGDDNWHEVSLLTIGYLGLIQQLDEVAGEVLLKLMDSTTAEPGQAVILAGEAVIDTWPGGVTFDCREKVVERLLQTLGDEGGVAPQHRAKGGQVLARLEDPRPEVMTMAGMKLCYIPTGSFWMGEGEEAHLNEYLDYDYWLGQYPVTNSQFHEFVEAGGYKNGAYWPEAIREDFWRDGRFKGRYDNNFRDGPYGYGHPFPLSNHPVVGVTWYESLAFCRWLTEAWQKTGWLASSESITLPSEAEWEKAARGGREIPAKVLVNAAGSRGSEQIQRHANPLPKRPFPWGNEEPEANLANYEKNIGSTTAVGCYPGNTSPYGCLDLAGNVWEWTRSLDHGYPYDPGDGREDLEKVKSNSVVQLRGGAWYHGATSLRCAARDWYDPNRGGRYLGFRVVVRPHFPPASGL